MAVNRQSKLQDQLESLRAALGRVPHVAQFWFVPHIPDGAGLFVHVCLFRLFVSLRGVEEAKLEARQESLNKGLAERKVAFTADQLEDIHVVCTAQST